MSSDVERQILEEEVFARPIGGGSKEGLVAEFPEEEFATSEGIRSVLVSFWTLPLGLQRRVSASLDLLLRAARSEDFGGLLGSLLLGGPSERKESGDLTWQISAMLCKKLRLVVMLISEMRGLGEEEIEAAEKACLLFALKCLESQNSRLREISRASLEETTELITQTEKVLVPFLVFCLEAGATAKLAVAQLVPRLADRVSSDAARDLLAPALRRLTRRSNPTLQKAALMGLCALTFVHKLADPRGELLTALLAMLSRGDPGAARLAGVALARARRTSGDGKDIQKLATAFFALAGKEGEGQLAFSEFVTDAVRPGEAGDWKAALPGLRRIGRLRKVDSEVCQLRLLSGFPGLAMKLTSKQVENDLLPLLRDDFLRGPREVRLKGYSVLPDLLRRLDPSAREQRIDLFFELLARHPRDWRLRAEAVDCTLDLARLFAPLTRLTKVIPLYFALMKDECSLVRKKAAALFWRVYIEVQDDLQAKEYLRLSMLAFGDYPKFTHRIAFIDMMRGLLGNALYLVDTEMVNTLLRIASDPVNNVLIQLGLLVSELQNSNPFSSKPSLPLQPPELPESPKPFQSPNFPRSPKLIQSPKEHEELPQLPESSNSWAQSGVWLPELVDKMCRVTDNDLLPIQRRILRDQPEKFERVSRQFQAQTEHKRKTIALENQKFSIIRAQSALDRSTSHGLILESLRAQAEEDFRSLHPSPDPLLDKISPIEAITEEEDEEAGSKRALSLGEAPEEFRTGSLSLSQLRSLINSVPEQAE